MWFRSVFIAVGLIAAAPPGIACADDATPREAVVYCYDRPRDQVTHVLAQECHGEVIDEAAAQAITERREQRMIRALGGAPSRVPEERRLAGIGTGFYVDEAGRLLTNLHVVDGCVALSLHASSGGDSPAQLLAVDAKEDLALLQGETSPRDFARFRAESAIGDEAAVAIIGYPDQGLPPLEPLLTAGSVLRSAVSTASGERVIIKAALRHGNSGGPIFDRQGLVIGVINAKVDTVRTYNATGREVDDIGQGIPLRAVMGFLQRNGARYQIEAAGETFDGKQILARAKTFVRRVNCWK